MPNTKSAKKRHKQNLQRRAYNRAYKAGIKTQLKEVRGAVKEGDMAKAAEGAKVTAKKADQAASKGVIHRNAAARIKSRLSASLKKAKQAAKA